MAKYIIILGALWPPILFWPAFLLGLVVVFRDGYYWYSRGVRNFKNWKDIVFYRLGLARQFPLFYIIFLVVVSWFGIALAKNWTELFMWFCLWSLSLFAASLETKLLSRIKI